MGLLLDQYECQCCDVSESVAGVAIVPRVMEEVGGVNLDVKSINKVLNIQVLSLSPKFLHKIVFF